MENGKIKKILYFLLLLTLLVGLIGIIVGLVVYFKPKSSLNLNDNDDLAR